MNAPTPANFTSAADIFATARHLKGVAQCPTFEEIFQHLLHISGDKGNQFDSGSFDNRCRFFGNGSANDHHHFLSAEKMQQCKGLFRIKGNSRRCRQGSAVDFGDQQGACRVENR